MHLSKAKAECHCGTGDHRENLQAIIEQAGNRFNGDFVVK
jgi:hypothetical protein